MPKGYLPPVTLAMEPPCFILDGKQCDDCTARRVVRQMRRSGALGWLRLSCGAKPITLASFAGRPRSQHEPCGKKLGPLREKALRGRIVLCAMLTFAVC